jgi:5'-3' exonuclease
MGTTYTNKNDIEVHLINTVVQKIRCYIALINPTDVLYISFDGVAPFAKMDQQRVRRYRSWFMNTMEFQPKTNNQWNTNAITPGTDFMNKLSKQLQFYFINQEPKYGVKKICVSGSDEAGEGEHKIFEHIRKNVDATSFLNNIAVYGLDSDLIMLSLFHCELCKNIYVFREAPEFVKSQINVTANKNDLLFMDIDNLSSCIVKEMQCAYTNESRVYDYIFLCFFLGNDFLPHFPSLNIRTSGIQTLMEMYRIHIGQYQDRSFICPFTNRIQWKWVQLFVNELAMIEHTLLLHEHNTRNTMDNYKWQQTTTYDQEKMFMNTPIILRSQEKYIAPEEPKWEDRYYKTLFHKKRRPETIYKICANYLEGLEWVYKYYTAGCPDWKWKYNYHYPPLLIDLTLCIPQIQMEFIKPTKKGSLQPFHPNTQLRYVLPRNNLSLLGKEQEQYLLKEYSKYYPEYVDFQWSYCRYFWESHALLPDIDLETLEKWDSEIQENQ